MSMVELAGPAWMAAIKDVLEQCLAGLDLRGRTVSISEEFTDPPAHLLAPGASSIAWHFSVTDDRVEIETGALATADLVTSIDYATCLPLARAQFSGEGSVEEINRLRKEAAGSGQMTRRGDEAALPPELLARLAKVHDEMARRTL